jgi:hypothetical protein
VFDIPLLGRIPKPVGLIFAVLEVVWEEGEFEKWDEDWEEDFFSFSFLSLSFLSISLIFCSCTILSYFNGSKIKQK